MKNNPKYKNVENQIRLYYHNVLSGSPVYLKREEALVLANKAGYPSLDDPDFNEALKFLSAMPDCMIYTPKKDECYLIIGDGLYQEDYSRERTSAGESVWNLIRQAQDKFRYYGPEMTSAEIEELVMAVFMRNYGEGLPNFSLDNTIKIAKTAGYYSVDCPEFASALINLQNSKKIYLVKKEDCYMILHESVVKEMMALAQTENSSELGYIQELKKKYL